MRVDTAYAHGSFALLREHKATYGKKIFQKNCNQIISSDDVDKWKVEKIM